MKYLNKIVGGIKRAVASVVLAGSLLLGSAGCYSGCAKTGPYAATKLQEDSHYSDLKERIKSLESLENDQVLWMRHKYGAEKLNEEDICDNLFLEHFNLSGEMQKMDGKTTNLAHHLAEERNKLGNPALVKRITDVANKYVLEDLISRGEVCEAFDTLNILNGGSQSIYSHDKKLTTRVLVALPLIGFLASTLKRERLAVGLGRRA